MLERSSVLARRECSLWQEDTGCSVVVQMKERIERSSKNSEKIHKGATMMASSFQSLGG